MEKQKKISEWKDIMVKELTEDIKKGSNFYLSDYLGLKADEMDELRRLLESHSCRYFVLKNSIAKIALEKAGLKELTRFIDGATGMILANDDPIAAAKAASRFSKSHEFLKLKGGYIDGNIVDKDRIKYMASLPAREILITKIVFGIKSPLSSFVNILGNTLKSLVHVMQAIKDRKGG